MEILELKDFSSDGAFFEDYFDQKFASYDWNRFDDKPVRVSNCGLLNVPGWVYLSIGIELQKHAKKIFFGDDKNPRKIYKREGDRVTTGTQVKHGT